MRPFLYKYFEYNENFKSSLRKGNLWFSDPSKFNDPFEFRLQVDKNLNEEDILEYFELYKKLSVNPSESVVLDFNNVLYKYRTSPQKFIQLYLTPFVEHIRNFGVCCFSTAKNNILMWSHYADKHSGIVVEYDRQLLDETIIKKNNLVQMTAIDQITYSNEFPLIKISSSHRKVSDEIKKVLFTKSVEWKYEKEVRIISNLIGEHRILRKCIRRVFLGHKFSDKNKFEIQNLLNDFFPNQDISIVEMTIDERSYSLKEKNT